MIDYADALTQILQELAPDTPDSLPASAAVGRILARDCAALESLPPFDNTAMDGFALQVPADGLPAGTQLPVVGMLAAGAEASHFSAGAVEIMTGAPMPRGYNGVIPVEATRPADDNGERRIEITEPVRQGQHVRRAGEDIAAGQRLLAAGTRIGTVELTLLAAQGIAQVEVMRRPRLAILATGRELIDDPDQALQPGQIRNSNRPYLQARAVDAGAQVIFAETVNDEIDDFLLALDRALDAGADMLISTGAVSMGRYDFVPEALARRGATIAFHKCRIRPGNPILFARLPGGQLYFGLPGNPVSSAVGFRFFVEPAIRRLLGMGDEQPLQLPLLNPLTSKPPLRILLKGRVEVDTEGRLGARILPGQESFRLHPLLESNAWLVAEASQGPLPAGERIAVFSSCHLQPIALQGVYP